MAGLESLDTSLTQEEMQIQDFKIIQTSKKKDSILYDGFYFNHMRDNKNSTVFKCRHIIEVDGKKRIYGIKRLSKQHDRMQPIQSEIIVILLEIDQIILAYPTQSI